MNPEVLYGDHWRSVEFVKDVQVPRLTTSRAAIVTAAVTTSRSDIITAQSAALSATRLVQGREGQTVRASEDLRKSVWGVVWESSWAEAWHLSWVLARVGIGLSTVDLVGTGTYTIEHYIELVGPWTTGFQDIPIPRKEIAA